MDALKFKREVDKIKNSASQETNNKAELWGFSDLSNAPVDVFGNIDFHDKYKKASAECAKIRAEIVKTA